MLRARVIDGKLKKEIEKGAAIKNGQTDLNFDLSTDGCPGLDSNQHILANAAT